MHKTL